MGDPTSGLQQPGGVEATFCLEVAPVANPVTRSITFTADGTTTVDTLAVGADVVAPDGVQTRSASALPDAQEKKVAGLWIGQYAPDGTRLSNQYIESVAGTSITVKLQKSDDCTVCFVANAGDLGAVLTKKELEDMKIPYKSTPDGRPQSNLLVMTGTCKANITGDKSQLPVKVTLTRLAAKITFTYKINGTGFSFTPASVSLENAPDHSQIGELTTQLASTEVNYGSYTGTVSTTGATMYWYLPENMAGSGLNTSNSEKEKTGQGVDFPTYIELTGDAVQNGVEYKNVTFRFYPGKDGNDYTISRNDHFVMNIDLRGLDVSDKRITVPTVPDITAPTGVLSPARGETCDVQITSRAGVVWSLQLPSWLSATIDGQTTPGGTTLTNQGPCTVTFTTTEIGPTDAGSRKHEFEVVLDENANKGRFTLTQIGALMIDQGVAEAYKKARPELTWYPPFNYDGGDALDKLGKDREGCSSTECTVDSPYYIEVSTEQPAGPILYTEALSKCPSGWRIPTIIEVWQMFQKMQVLQDIPGFEPLNIKSDNWSSSVFTPPTPGPYPKRCYFNKSGSFGALRSDAFHTAYVRCVRDIK